MTSYSPNGKARIFQPNQNRKSSVERQSETYVGLLEELKQVPDLGKESSSAVERWASRLANGVGLTSFEIRALEEMYGRLCR